MTRARRPAGCRTRAAKFRRGGSWLSTVNSILVKVLRYNLPCFANDAAPELHRVPRHATSNRGGESRRQQPRKCFVLSKFGAGEGNRTLVCSLGSCRSTIELRPRSACVRAILISRDRGWRQAVWAARP